MVSGRRVTRGFVITPEEVVMKVAGLSSAMLCVVAALDAISLPAPGQETSSSSRERQTTPPAPSAQDFSTLGLFTLPAGATITLEFDATVRGTIPAGITAVSNQASVDSLEMSGPVVSDEPTTGLSGVEWTCVASGGASCTAGPVNGDINDSVDLPAGSSVGYTGHPKPHVAAFIALSRQRHKVIFKLLTTDARDDMEKLIASHLARLEMARMVAA